MNATLTDELYTQLQREPLRQMSQQLGIGPTQMAGALSAALPMLLGMLGQNAQQPQVAQSLLRQGGANDGGSSEASPQVLGQVLGQEQQQVRQQGGLGGGLLGAILDQDGDGELGLGDLIEAGSGLLGGRR